MVNRGSWKHDFEYSSSCNYDVLHYIRYAEPGRFYIPAFCGIILNDAVFAKLDDRAPHDVPLFVIAAEQRVIWGENIDEIPCCDPISCHDRFDVLSGSC